MEILSTMQRTPRQYKKKAADYWLSGILESRAKRPRFRQQEPSPDHTLQNIADLIPAMIRSKLRELGVNTRVRNVKKLQEMYTTALQSATQPS